LIFSYQVPEVSPSDELSPQKLVNLGTSLHRRPKRAYNPNGNKYNQSDSSK